MSKKLVIKTLSTALVIAITTFIVSPMTFAAAGSCSNNYSLTTGINCGNTGGQSNQSVEQTIQSVLNVAMWAVGIIAVVIIIFAGIMYATAAGDEAKVKKAKHALIGGIVGLAIAMLAFAITRFIQGVVTA